MLPYFLLAAVLTAADQAVKAWTVARFAAPAAGFTATADPYLPCLPGLLELTRVHNYGAAWSSFSGMRWLLSAVTAAILAVVLVLLLRGVVRHPAGRLAGALILSGGLGNLIDRLRLGYVVDMFHLPFWPSYPTFNVADVCIVSGAILGALYYVFLYEKYDGRKTDGAADAGKHT